MTDLHDRVLDWYAEHARDLPWRAPEAGPWAVMVSEFMLQQTPVARVRPVYEQWLAAWPSPADLAAAIQEITTEVEWAIREEPFQWFCFRKLWD